MARSKGLTGDQLAELCRRYRGGEHQASLARYFGVNQSTVAYWVNKLGARTTFLREHHRRFQCNHEFFTDIQTEAQAYWLGFIMADGNLSDSGVLEIGLQERDRGHLEWFLSCIGSNHRIYPGSPAQGKAVRVMICSPKFAIDLPSYGVIPRKTGQERWPDLPRPLLRHFLRGYFDGDGWFSYEAPSGYSFNIMSGYGFLSAAQHYLMKACSLPQTRFIETPGAGILRYRGRLQVLRIERHIYCGATIYLRRKRDALPTGP